MASSSSSYRAGSARSGKTSPGSSSSTSSTRRLASSSTRLTARDIMAGKTSSNPPPSNPKGFNIKINALRSLVSKPLQSQLGSLYSSYPGFDAILKSARKIKPFSETDKEQRARALFELIPSGIPKGGINSLIQAMEDDYLYAVATWRADNWLVPSNQESEFPYSRTRNIGDASNADFKYGAAWLPRWNSDSGANYDGEGERIPHSEEMENIDRAAIIRESDLRIKGIEERDPVLYEKMDTVYADMLAKWGLSGLKDSVKPRPTDDKVLLKMKSENAEIRSAFDRVIFDRYEEVWNTYAIDGYTISRRYRAFKLYSKEQQKLLQAYESADGQAKHDAKKALLTHVTLHGQLLPKVPEPDAPAPKPKVEAKVTLGRRALRKSRHKGVDL